MVVKRLVQFALMLVVGFACQNTEIKETRTPTKESSSDLQPIEEPKVEEEQEQELIANQPAIVAGSYLFCASMGAEESTESISCAVRDEDNQKLRIEGVKTLVAEAIFADRNERIDIEWDHSTETPWHFSIAIPRNVLEIYLAVEDLDGSVQEFTSDIQAIDAQDMRFVYNLVSDEEYIHLGDGAANNQDECSSKFSVPNIIADKDFFKGRSAVIQFDVQEATDLSLDLQAVCDVADSQISQARLVKIENETATMIENLVLTQDGDLALFAGALEPGVYQLEIVAGINIFGIIDEFMLKNVQVTAKNNLGLGQWTFK